MTADALRTYRQRLEADAARLAAGVTALHTEDLRPIASADDLTDPGEQAAAEGVSLTLFGAEGHTLAEVNAALDRLDRGTFGQCETCGKPVGRNRLAALPHARHCARCATSAGG